MGNFNYTRLPQDLLLDPEQCDPEYFVAYVKDIMPVMHRATIQFCPLDDTKHGNVNDSYTQSQGATKIPKI